jgi:hypothetical protein
MEHLYNSCVINAPLNQVWEAVKDFHNMDWAEGVIDKVDKVGELNGSEIGARRKLNGVFNETLRELNEEDHLIRYTIDDGPEPVSREKLDQYLSTIHMTPVTDSDSTFVEWSADYSAKNPQDVGAFCDPLYQNLLKALKEKFS